MKNDVGKVVLAVFVVAILAAVLVAVIGGRQQAHVVSYADVDAQAYTFCGRSVSDFYGRGQFNDPAADSRKYGEVFTTTRLWYSWFVDGESRPVTVEARLRACNTVFGFPSPPDHVYYRFEYSTDGNSWVGFTNDHIPAGVFSDQMELGAVDKNVALGAFELIVDGFQFEPCTFADNVRDNGRGPEGWGTSCTPGTEVRTIVDGAALRVRVLVSRLNAPGGLNNYEPMLIMEDEIELRSALPSIAWTQGAYKIGETARARWEVPTATYEDCDSAGSCTTRPAYFVSVIDLNTDAPVLPWERKPVSGVTGHAEFAVTATYFSSNLATCQNRLRAILYTEIVIADVTDSAVQNDTNLSPGAAPPAVTRIVFDKPEYQEGDTFTVSWNVTGNVTRVHVTAHIGGLIVLDDDFDGLVTSATSTAPATGALEVEVTPYDKCNPGSVKKATATVGNVFPGLCNLFPDNPTCRTSEGALWWAYLIAGLGVLAIILAFGLGFMLLGSAKALEDDLLVVFMGALLIAGAVAVALTVFGAFDVFLLGIVSIVAIVGRKRSFGGSGDHRPAPGVDELASHGETLRRGRNSGMKTKSRETDSFRIRRDRDGASSPVVLVVLIIVGAMAVAALGSLLTSHQGMEEIASIGSVADWQDSLTNWQFKKSTTLDVEETSRVQVVATYVRRYVSDSFSQPTDLLLQFEFTGCGNPWSDTYPFKNVPWDADNGGPLTWVYWDIPDRDVVAGSTCTITLWTNSMLSGGYLIGAWKLAHSSVGVPQPWQHTSALWGDVLPPAATATSTSSGDNLAIDVSSTTSDEVPLPPGGASRTTNLVLIAVAVVVLVVVFLAGVAYWWTGGGGGK